MSGSNGPAGPGSLEGKFLIAMPGIGDPRFERSVIYMCAHSPDGAMGLVVNKLAPHVSFSELLSQLGIEGEGGHDIRVHFGGPVEMGRGFVLHSRDYALSNTVEVGSHASLTATVDILHALATGEGPRQSLFALGYASWHAGQLDAEMQMNGWLHAEADPDLLFSSDLDTKWTRAIGMLGIDIAHLSQRSGHA